MSTAFQNINITRKRVLVAPLDWGLGHATRCIPIIQELVSQNFEVLIAAKGKSADLLREEFPDITIISLEGYNIKYAKSKLFFSAIMLFQIPKIIKAIKSESRWLAQKIREYKIDIVISDNRYGLYDPKIKSIFITHQLAIETGNAITNKIIQKINYKLINKFDACWVPDEKAPYNLAGKLSNPQQFPALEIKYIGTLSRFKKEEMTKSIDLLVSLSGPEPQRTILEKMLIVQMEDLLLKTVFVRGLPGVEKTIISNKGMIIHNHLSAKALSEVIQSSKVIVARSGYSTIMDLVSLQQQAILIPTPGQTEQEYLAKYLSEKKYFISAEQADFNLEKEIKNLMKSKPLENIVQQKNQLQEAIKALK